MKSIIEMLLFLKVIRSICIFSRVLFSIFFIQEAVFVVSMGSYLDVSNWLNPAKLTLYYQTNTSTQWVRDYCGQRTTDPCEQLCDQDTGEWMSTHTHTHTHTFVWLSLWGLAIDLYRCYTDRTIFFYQLNYTQSSQNYYYFCFADFIR